MSRTFYVVHEFDNYFFSVKYFSALKNDLLVTMYKYVQFIFIISIRKRGKIRLDIFSSLLLTFVVSL